MALTWSRQGHCTAQIQVSLHTNIRSILGGCQHGNTQTTEFFIRIVHTSVTYIMTAQQDGLKCCCLSCFAVNAIQNYPSKTFKSKRKPCILTLKVNLSKDNSFIQHLFIES